VADKTRIEWTEATWNPITGCSKVSPGCARCYAETLSLRFRWGAKSWLREHARENLMLYEQRLDQPLERLAQSNAGRGHRRALGCRRALDALAAHCSLQLRSDRRARFTSGWKD
jgi:hypothetical protein